jgi:predicted Fe-S protein YdhL (DUF1289 family)
MRRRLQFAGWWLALAMSAAVAVPSFAQRPPANPAPNRPAARPPGPQRQPQRQPQTQAHPQPQRAPQARNERPNPGANRSPNSNGNRAGATTPNNNSNRPLSAYAPPPKRNFNDLSPQDKQKVVQSYKNFQKLPPAQRQQQKEAAANWSKLTPDQKNHIRNDVIPKWKQMPADRQRAISQRLGVLQNMPESARNQHLNDPNFTRGMSEQDKATLRDLSHMHVGGAPETPNE